MTQGNISYQNCHLIFFVQRSFFTHGRRYSGIGKYSLQSGWHADIFMALYPEVQGHVYQCGI